MSSSCQAISPASWWTGASLLTGAHENGRVTISTIIAGPTKIGLGPGVQGDLISRLISPASHIITAVIPIVNLLTKTR